MASRPLKVGINYRYVSERWHRLMSELGYSRYSASGYDFGAGVTTILALDHPESVMAIYLTTLESDLAPVVDDTELSDAVMPTIHASKSGSPTSPFRLTVIISLAFDCP
jgi:pimeloyl-ACP methyl ester carboxylesterase